MALKATRLLKQQPKLEQIPVIIVSAKDQEKDIIAGLEAGALDYIPKPISFPTAVARIQAALRVKNYQDSIRMLNEELGKSMQAAQSSLKARQAFFANMSHEIRTPITAIMGLSEILASDEVGPLDNKAAAETILSNSRYLLEVVNNILDISKAESGQMDVERVNCSLMSILEGR